MSALTREETLELIQEVLEVYPDKAKKERAKHLAVNDPTVEQSKKCIISNRKSLPGVMTVRGCAYAGSKGVVWGPIKDMIHISHGPWAVVSIPARVAATITSA
jgi:nitrogenase molybdenum-iron protein alpha chain